LNQETYQGCKLHLNYTHRIEKKSISIAGKADYVKTFFVGEIIDGVNHTFTSSLTAGCELLDIYFWNRFPEFKDIESVNDLANKDNTFLFMRWYEKGVLKKRKIKKE
jgi:hypothetical protein